MAPLAIQIHIHIHIYICTIARLFRCCQISVPINTAVDRLLQTIIHNMIWYAVGDSQFSRVYSKPNQIPLGAKDVKKFSTLAAATRYIENGECIAELEVTDDHVDLAPESSGRYISPQRNVKPKYETSTRGSDVVLSAVQSANMVCCTASCTFNAYYNATENLNAPVATTTPEQAKTIGMAHLIHTVLTRACNSFAVYSDGSREIVFVLQDVSSELVNCLQEVKRYRSSTQFGMCTAMFSHCFDLWLGIIRLVHQYQLIVEFKQVTREINAEIHPPAGKNMNYPGVPGQESVHTSHRSHTLDSNTTDPVTVHWCLLREKYHMDRLTIDSATLTVEYVPEGHQVIILNSTTHASVLEFSVPECFPTSDSGTLFGVYVALMAAKVHRMTGLEIQTCDSIQSLLLAYFSGNAQVTVRPTCEMLLMRISCCSSNVTWAAVSSLERCQQVI